jgi:hypothetical protein
MLMRYLAAWRLWKYDPCYRDPSGELWVSVFEPVRLWRARKLDLYIGHPLFAGRGGASFTQCHSGAAQSAEPGTHNHRPEDMDSGYPRSARAPE